VSSDIVLERRGTSADTTVHLSRFLGTTEHFWLNLEGPYEVSRVKPERRFELERIKPLVSSDVSS
jgi:plasmid maintenance system antidote protein VapI